MGKPTTKASHFIQELVKATFSPMVLGLRDPILREVRDGVLILFNEGHRLENLKEAIQKNPKSATTLLTREPKNENQFLISGVDSEVKDTELPVSLIQQNNTEGEPTEIKLLQKFTNESTSTNIVEAEPPVYYQLKEIKKVLFGWTSCPIRENLYNCAARNVFMLDTHTDNAPIH